MSPTTPITTMTSNSKIVLIALLFACLASSSICSDLEKCLNGEEEGDACARFLSGYKYSLDLGEARVDYTPAKGIDALDVVYPQGAEEGRGVLKKKLLLPILLLLKLKMKALQPLLLAIVGFKALKALILSKLAIGVVLVFVIMQLCKKMGMPMPMSMEPAPATAAMPPPMTPMTGYGAPPAAPTNSYGEPPSSWDSGSSNGGNGYQRVWQDAHQMAYNAYAAATQNSGSGSSGSSSGTSSASSKPLVASQY